MPLLIYEEVIPMTVDECRVETQKHIEKVRKYIRFFTDKLTTRGVNHDASKLESPEAEIFAEHTDCLKDLIYDSEEYKEHLADMKPALEHHYALYNINNFIGFNKSIFIYISIKLL